MTLPFVTYSTPDLGVYTKWQELYRSLPLFPSFSLCSSFRICVTESSPGINRLWRWAEYRDTSLFPFSCCGNKIKKTFPFLFQLKSNTTRKRPASPPLLWSPFSSPWRASASAWWPSSGRWPRTGTRRSAGTASPAGAETDSKLYLVYSSSFQLFRTIHNLSFFDRGLLGLVSLSQRAEGHLEQLYYLKLFLGQFESSGFFL